MQVLQGKDVDVISPFPQAGLVAAVGWMHCYKTLVFGDQGPQTEEDILKFLQVQLQSPLVRTWGIVDKANLTASRQVDIPLVGIIVVEQLTFENGYIHIASSRKAWGNRLAKPGLVDQGCELAKQDVWDSTSLRRLSIATFANNRAARQLALRQGFSQDGYFQGMGTLRGQPTDIVHYGLQRPAPSVPIQEEAAVLLEA